MQGEHRLPYELVRPVLDHSGEVVAVLDWKGEIAFLHRGAHSRAVQCRTPAGEDEPLRPAAEGAPGRAHRDLARLRPGKRGGTQFCPPARHIPERQSAL